MIAIFQFYSSSSKEGIQDGRLLHCAFCPKSFVFKSDLDKHENIHTKKKKYACDHCSKTFLHQTSLRVHLRTHGLFSTTFECSYCGLRMNDASNLRCHLRTHTGEKPFECSQCSKKFARTSDLKQHELCHEK